MMLSKIKTKYTWLNVLLLACAFCQIVLTTYFTIFEGKIHMGIDSSWEYLKVMVAAKEGVIFPSAFVNTTTHPEFERLILAVPLYKLTGNVFLAYGLTNLVINLLTVLLIIKVCRNYKFSTTTALIIVNLFECPFLASGYSIYNELGYHECVNGFAAYYNVLILAFYLILYFFSSEEGNNIIIGLITIITLAYVAMNKGSGIVVWLGFPIIVYLVLMVFIENDWKILKEKKTIYLLSFIAAMLVGRTLGSLVGFSYLDEGTNWVSAVDFFKNAGNIVVGFGALLGGIPDMSLKRNVASFSGVVFVFGLVITFCFFISIINTIINVAKQSKAGQVDRKILFVQILLIASICVLLFMAPYDVAEYYSVRYLILPVQSGFILIGLFIESLDEKLILRQVGTVLLFFSIVCMNLYSDYFMSVVDNKVLKYDDILSTIETTDVDLVYFWDDTKFLLDTERVLRVVDDKRIYKCISNINQLEYFGDYKYYDDSAEYTGSTAIITPKINKAVPDSIIEQYDLLKEIGDYKVYYCKNNPVDLKSFVESR